MASSIGKNTRVGSGAPCCARYINIDTGSKVSDDAFKTKNIICASLATTGSGLSDCNSRMAFKPMGVAALSKPSALAVKFIVIKPRAGWPAGTPGSKRINKGESRRASELTKPARSAIRKNPSHKVSVPNNKIMTSTESLAIANKLSTIAANTLASPMTSNRHSALAVATKKNPSQRKFNMR